MSSKPKVVCPNCGQSYDYPTSRAGKAVSCVTCKGAFVVPAIDDGADARTVVRGTPTRAQRTPAANPRPVVVAGRDSEPAGRPSSAHRRSPMTGNRGLTRAIGITVGVVLFGLVGMMVWIARPDDSTSNRRELDRPVVRVLTGRSDLPQAAIRGDRVEPVEGTAEEAVVHELPGPQIFTSGTEPVAEDLPPAEQRAADGGSSPGSGRVRFFGT